MSIITQSRKLFAFFLLGIAGLALAWVVLRPPPSASAGLVLRPPSFTTEVITSTAFLSEEAGITAYVHAGQPIRLDYVKSAFRTVEDQTEDYLIGSVGVPDVSTSFDVHVYVHRTGWVVAYYLPNYPVSRIVYPPGWSYNPSNLERVISKVLAKDGLDLPPDGVNYYDFRYPDATHIMFIRKKDGSFQINIPSSFEIYERSFAIGSTWGDASFWIDGIRVGTTSGGWKTDFISADRLLPDLVHILKIDTLYGGSRCSFLILVYREPH